MANYYGCLVQPARVRHPKDKATVENSVKLIYQRVYAPLRKKTFYSIEELNKSLSACMKAHNQKRMTQYDYTREECFLANEKPKLKPLPRDDYEVKRIHELTVTDNCFVYIASLKEYYSVPYQWVGQKVKVVITRTLVSIFAQGVQVAVHRRDKGGKYRYDETHFPPKSAEWRGRNRQTFIDAATRIHTCLGLYVKGVFDNCGTSEQLMYKSCDAILSLGRHTNPDILIKAIETATQHKRYGYKWLLSFIAKYEAESVDTIPIPPPNHHSGLRGKEAFK
jgi:hypothetical protein